MVSTLIRRKPFAIFVPTNCGKSVSGVGCGGGVGNYVNIIKIDYLKMSEKKYC
jgi:hypothetical protein